MWQVRATDKQGRIHTATFSDKEKAKHAANEIRGQYPWHNRVKVVELKERPQTSPELDAALTTLLNMKH